MGRFDTSHMRYLKNDDFRVLTAVEMGSKNHEVVPTKLIQSISGLKSPGLTNKCISELAKIKLIAKMKNAKYDGYRLTFHGYDYLALKAFVKRDSVLGVGTQIGIGKESDIFLCYGQGKVHNVLKIHRLGRISFRSVKNNRDYLKGRSSASWMYLSRLSAQREFAFMKILHDHGFPVPVPIDQSRHHIVMNLIEGYPMRQMRQHDDPARLYSTLMDFVVKLANHGLIHCDFNEFNIMIRHEYEKPEDEIIVIDFPQCISTMHVDAKRYFERDVNCIREFFEKKLGYVAEEWPTFDDIERVEKLDLLVEASGLNKKQLKDLDKAMEESRAHFGDEEEYLGSDFDEDDFIEEENGDEDEEEDEEDGEGGEGEEPEKA